MAHARKTPGGTATALCRKAEARLHMIKRDISALPITDVQRLVYELQLHQLELEQVQASVRKMRRGMDKGLTA